MRVEATLRRRQMEKCVNGKPFEFEEMWDHSLRHPEWRQTRLLSPHAMPPFAPSTQSRVCLKAANGLAKPKQPEQPNRTLFLLPTPLAHT
eukprot:scaffold2078_cov181-Pinguiococcus_pyrenoidosus.AAC.2